MSSTTDPGSRSAAEIEREVEQTRASLTDTLDKLRKRTSPGQHLVAWIAGPSGVG
jgi:hypothetical protein